MVASSLAQRSKSGIFICFFRRVAYDPLQFKKGNIHGSKSFVTSTVLRFHSSIVKSETFVLMLVYIPKTLAEILPYISGNKQLTDCQTSIWRGSAKYQIELKREDKKKYLTKYRASLSERIRAWEKK